MSATTGDRLALANTMKIRRQIVLFLTVLILLGCEANFVDYHSKLEVEAGNFNYALFLDGVGIGDPGYTVVKLEKNLDPEDLYIKWTPSEGINYDVNHEQIDWFRKEKY
ncbi:MAG: hypothetical protein R8N23_04465 [Reichenbachiella sp.]|uniref:hypothetical protein n=1 Tax=Reichenbachiella sp. TaxID=2184521 RepID=UPI002965F13D|nr:hypothetical protein [Reichenbachiella sp.]MDW3209095.1 hypothetical protein [Reichenbachiella sp.]